MRATLALAEPAWEELTRWLAEPDEVAGIMSARVVATDGAVTLFGRSLRRSPETSYNHRGPEGLELRSTGWVPAVRDAAFEGSVALFVHTHPNGVAAFSQWDDAVDADLAPSFWQITDSTWYVAVVIAGTPENPSICARIRSADGANTDIDLVRVVGDRIRVFNLAGDDSTHDVFDRQVRAFGSAGQLVLDRLRVGIVGAGGTGSPIAEQLIRLGVGTVIVVDDDEVTPSTVSRGYGSRLSSVGQAKVDVLQAHSDSIGLGTKLVAVRGNLRDRAVISELAHCDVVFSCVDGHAARLVLNRWAYAHLAPVIDVAVLVTTNEEHRVEVDGRITWLAPGASCLLCRGRIDPTIAYAEHLDPAERRRLLAQGYVPDLDEPQPSVVTFTTLVAGFAATEFLNRLFGLASTSPSEILLRLSNREISLNRRPPRDGCFCADTAYWGRAATAPYLDLTWTS